MPAFEIIDYALAAERFDLPGWMKDWTILLHSGDLTLDRHLLVDWQHDAPLPGEQAVLLEHLLGPVVPRGEYGVVIDGNLTVSGSILNTNMDGGPSFVVTGETNARSLLAGGAYLSFAGPARFTEAIYADYNHGETNFFGPVSAPLLINSDHALYLGHPSRHGNIAAYFNDMDSAAAPHGEADDEGALPQVIAEVVRPEFAELSEIREALENGRDILR